MNYYFFSYFFFNDTATTEIYTLSLHDALPISTGRDWIQGGTMAFGSGDFVYEVEENWWTLPEGWSFGWIPAVAVDSKDRVHVYSRSEHPMRSEEHTSELQSQAYLVCRLLLEKKKHTSELPSQPYLVSPYSH